MVRPVHRLVRALRRARTARGLSTATLSRASKAAPSRLRDLECGRATAPILRLLDDLGRPMGMTLGWRYSRQDGRGERWDRTTRDACAEAICHGCARAWPMERSAGVWVHALPKENGLTVPCRATAIFDKITEDDL